MKMHEKHRGHESMHAEMILILFATLIISQIALVKWRQIYPNSYHVSFENVLVLWEYLLYLLVINAHSGEVKLPANFITLFIQTAMYVSWNVVNPIFALCQKFLVSIYCDLVRIYTVYCNYYAQSIRKADTRFHA